MTHDFAGTADLFAALASEHNLLDTIGTSPDGLPERYLYSRNMDYRYAFGRWWGPADPSTSDVWVLLNPRLATPSSVGVPPWTGASPGPGPTDRPA